MVTLGLAASFAEMVGVSVAVMFLFALLDQSETLRGGDGLVAEAFRWTEATIGADMTLIPAAFVIVIALNAALLYAYQVCTATMLNRVAQQLRDRVHDIYVKVGYRYIQARDQGELLHTLSTETWAASEAVFGVARIAINLCAVAVFGAGIFMLSWQIGLIALVSALAVLALTRLLAAPARRYGEMTLEANQVLAERMLVSLQGMRTIRIFAREPYVLRLFEAASFKVRRLATRTEWLTALVRPIVEIAAVCTLIAIALTAMRLGVDTPTTIAAALLLFRLQPHLREMQNHNVALSALTATLRKTRGTIERSDKLWPTQGETVFTGLRREIRLEDVGFEHAGRDGTILDGINLTIRKGEVTALSGPSGSGKTTIVNLLLRLYEPDRGRILVDGQDLNRLTRESWLTTVALAGQDLELIDGTIAQNLRLARPDATVEEMREACATVEILADIDALPEGINTRIGPGGSSFSGGQRQRLGLARAVIHKPDVLILDEALSAVEPALEDRIRDRLLRLMAGKTIVSISHRRDGADWADVVIRVEGGAVVGTTRRREPACGAVAG